MINDLVPAIVVPAIFFSIVWMVRIISDNKLKKELMNRGLGVEELKIFLLNQTMLPKSNPFSNLKWGMVLMSFGIAIFAGMLSQNDEQQGFVTSGLIFLLSGVSLVIYHIIAKREENKNEN